MHQLKDIAARMDNACTRTAKRWWKKLNVPPDVTGHGPHRWHDASADRIVKLWEGFYKSRGTTPQIVKAKYAGKFTDNRQMNFNFDEKNTVKKAFPKTQARRGRKSSFQSARSRR